MDLLKLNNEICSMRPAARQAKVHVIHNLTRNARKFEIKKGNETVVAKNKKRAEKLKEEALIDKVLTPDEIIKFALQFDSGLRDKVLDDVEIPLSAKAFARLASHPVMVEAVQKFRTKYPDWHKHLEKSLEKLGTGSRFGSKMKNGRVKAHLVQRQRVEEAVDTIRRAQMSWIHRSASTKAKNISEDKDKSSKDESLEGRNETSVNIKEEAESEHDTIKKGKGTLHYEEVDEDESSDEEEINGGSESEDEGDLDEKEDIHQLNENDEVEERGEMEDQDESDEEEEEDTEDESDGELEEKKKFARNENKLPKVKLEDSDDLIKEENKKLSNLNQKSAKQKDAECEVSGASNSKNLDSKNDTGSLENTTNKSLNKKTKKSGRVEVPRSREAEVCKFSDLLQKEQQTRRSENISTADSSSDSENESDSSSKSDNKGVDPFFVTKNNDFLRIAAAKIEEEPEEDEDVRKGPKWGVEGCENWTGTRKERRARAFGRPVPRKFDRRGAFSDFNSSYQNSNRNYRNADTPVQAERSVPNEEPEKLHPSWAAKRKLQPSLTEFQGKKVKFDDSD